MVDTNCPWTPDEAVAMAKRMAPHDLLWLEEPVWPPENYDGMARVRTEGGVAVAAGESGCTMADFEALVGRAKVNYVQPSVAKIGGITAMKQVIALAQAQRHQGRAAFAVFRAGLRRGDSYLRVAARRSAGRTFLLRA